MHKKVYGNPCKYSAVNGPIQQQDLTGIANELGIKTAGRDEKDLKRRITTILGSKKTDVPETLTPDQMEEVEGFLSGNTKEKVEKLNEFASGLEGKTIIFYVPEK